MTIENQEKVLKEFATKWGLDKDQAYYIFNLIDQTGGRYGKSSRILKGFGFKKSPRQLRYFHRKVRLHVRLEISKRGRPANYREMLKRG